jgi:hypothetical protein
LRLRRGKCRGFRNVSLWADGSHTTNLLLANPSCREVVEPWYLISNAEPALDLDRSYGRRFCGEQLFRDQKFDCFQLKDSGVRDPLRDDRLLLVVTFGVLAGNLQGYALSLAGLKGGSRTGNVS